MKAVRIVLVILVALHFSNAKRKPSSKSLQKKIDNKIGDSALAEEFERSYHQNKEKAILDIIKTLKEDMYLSNVTLVGSQNIYNVDGSLKEIRTIELAIPEFQEEEIFFDDINTEVINKVRAKQLLGFNIELYTFQTIEDDFEEELYMFDGLKAVRSDGGSLINQTIHVKDVNELKNDYNSRCIRCENNISSRLVFDENGKLISSKSSVVPELFASIGTCNGVPGEDIIKTSLDIFVKSVLEAEELKDIPETVRNVLQQKFPNVVFLVATDVVGSFYMNNEFSIEMTYDYIYTPDVVKLTVYGYFLDITTDA